MFQIQFKMQVYVVPPSQSKGQSHRRLGLPRAAVGATFEQSTRLLCLLFAKHGSPQATKLGFYVFDADFQRLSKTGAELTWPCAEEELVNADGQMARAMPCILLPRQAASWDDSSTVSKRVAHVHTLVQCGTLF
jgi:hypothetical protein